MLSEIEHQAIRHCLTGINERAHQSYPWPGPTMLAGIRSVPLIGHPDPTAQHAHVWPAPVPAEAWQHPDGPLAALQTVAADLASPVLQAKAALPRPSGLRVLAWAFLYSTGHGASRSRRVRRLEAVDIDAGTYSVIHKPGNPAPQLQYADSGNPCCTPEVVAALGTLAKVFEPD